MVTFFVTFYVSDGSKKEGGLNKTNDLSREPSPVSTKRKTWNRAEAEKVLCELRPVEDTALPKWARASTPDLRDEGEKFSGFKYEHSATPKSEAREHKYLNPTKSRLAKARKKYESNENLSSG